MLGQNIGAFAEEDEAYELLKSLSISLPLAVMVTWVLDAVLAAVYLTWFHPWRNLLQKVTFLSGFELITIPQDLDEWEPEAEDEADGDWH